MYRDLHVYLDIDPELYIDDDQYIKNLYSIVSVLYQHQVNLYYSHLQITYFAEQCNNLDENFSSSVGNRLQVLLQNATAINEQDTYVFEVNFSRENSSISHIPLTILKSIAHSHKLSLITLSQKFDFSKRYFLRIASKDIFDRIEISILKSTETFLKWMWDNGEERHFNLSPKHGENGKGNWPNASPLRCDQDQAQMYLKVAIGDLNKSTRLFYFDEEHSTFIEFFYEGSNPQKKWHGFHIETKDWIDRVPSSVRKFYKK